MAFMAPIISALGLLLYVCSHRLAERIVTNRESRGHVEVDLRRIGEIAYFCGLLAYLLTNHLALNVLFK